jgi:dihydrofolate reductase
MRKVILLMHISLDGFVADANSSLEWVRHDEEVFQYVTDHLQDVDAAVYGRTTYGMMEEYWPTVRNNPNASALGRHHAEWVEEVHKVVFSTTLQKVTWNNTTLINSGDTAAAVARLKQQPGKKLMIFGSPRLTYSFMEHDLIDEYLIQVNPVILGEGIPLFKQVQQRTNLQLLKAVTFKTGVVGLHYETKHS